jgi:hypothetical protein
MNCKQKHQILTWFQGIFSRKTFYGKKDRKNFIPFFLLKIICTPLEMVSVKFFFLSISIKTIHWTCWRMIIICYIICIIMTSINKRLSWSWSYGSWINNYLCNQCLSPLMLWVRTLFMVRYTQYNIMWWFVGDLWQVCSFLHQ